jgi:lambda repressor-like predicted transcriptional regulator
MVRCYTVTMAVKTELEKISERIRNRQTLDEKDRARQRELIREAIAAGRTWDAVQREAGISRPTLRNALSENYPPCTREGCERPATHRKRTLCTKHYEAARRLPSA